MYNHSRCASIDQGHGGVANVDSDLAYLMIQERLAAPDVRHINKASVFVAN
jgi:hypothetical protein